MCGIIHVKKFDTSKKANKTILKRFEKQIERGTQGFGFVELKNGIVIAETRTETKKDILAKLEKSDADEILFHHRIPTSTPNFIESTHPILVRNASLKYDYYVLHNGIIENDESLYSEHTKSGFTYTTEIRKKYVTQKTIYSEILFNDSESLAIDFVLAIENKQTMKAVGSIAIVCLQFDKKTKKAVALYYGRNGGNPLTVESNKDLLCIASENGKSIPTDTLYRYDYKTNKTTSTDFDIGTYETRTSTTTYSSTYGYDYGYPPTTGGYKLDDDDNDNETEYEMELEYLRDELKKAKNRDDYDAERELEIEIEELEIQKDAESRLQTKWKY